MWDIDFHRWISEILFVMQMGLEGSGRNGTLLKHFDTLNEVYEMVQIVVES